MADRSRRALLASPDEDVCSDASHVARRLSGVLGLGTSALPRPQVVGRGAGLGPAPVQRFGCESLLDDRTFVLKGDGSVAGGLDFFAAKVKIPEGVDSHFASFDADKGDRLVTFGWAMAEDLAGGKLGR